MKVIEITSCDQCPKHSFKAYPYDNREPRMVCNFEKEFLKQKLIPIKNLEEKSIPDFCKLKEI